MNPEDLCVTGTDRFYATNKASQAPVRSQISISSTAMNYVLNSEILLFLRHYAVIQFAIQFPLFGFSESTFGKQHLIVFIHLDAVHLT